MPYVMIYESDAPDADLQGTKPSPGKSLGMFELVDGVIYARARMGREVMMAKILAGEMTGGVTAADEPQAWLARLHQYLKTTHVWATKLQQDHPSGPPNP